MTLTKPKHIFIVEDNEIYSMMLDYILSKDSIYEFVHFKSGEECLANLHLNPDIIILDYGLPGMNGYETLLEIKKYNPNIHVVFLSNNEDEKLKRKLLKAGADYYVLKQGHGEKEIVDKIDMILTDEEAKKESGSVITGTSLTTKVFFILLII
ncbi:MAG: response regulator, partial [Bacteroidia bacterium]